MSDEINKPGPEQQNNGNKLHGRIKSMRARLDSALDGQEVVPETIERAHLEAAEESISQAHSLFDYMKAQIGSSDIIADSGATMFVGGSLDFKDQGIVLSLGLPDHNFYVMYGFRAEQRGRELDVNKYVDLVVEDLERKIAQGVTPNMSYELYPLREAIEFILMREHGYKRGAELNRKAREIEERATKILSTFQDPMNQKEIVIDDVSIPRVTEVNRIRIFDVECYT